MTAFLTITFDANYAGPAGEIFPAGTLAAQSGISVIENISIEQSALLPFIAMVNAAQTHMQVYGQADEETGAAVAIGTSAFLAVQPTTDLSTMVVKLMVTGARA